ncbi:hypothetical protein AB0A95_30465 [Micromonospora sp. NPDC049230]|uniref:hypothetical protein n=1 Tax=Micromonospora sp. NPDC049230 TaxID=3155502 RepID=UPI003409D17E
MALTTITRSCGHPEQVQIHGSNTHGQRDRRAQRLASEPCAKCQSTGRAELNARAADVAEHAGWPQLTGSARQVGWAQTIRVDMLTALADTLAATAPASVVGQVTSLYTAVLLRQTDAPWWIANKARDGARLAARLMTDADRAELAALREISDERTQDTATTEQPTGDAVTAQLRADIARRDRGYARETALKHAGQRAAEARLARATAIAEIGRLLREDQDDNNEVGIVRAEHLTGLSRPTLTDARDDTEAWAEVVKLAEGTLAGYDDDEAALHARLPYLAGLDAAASYLYRLHEDRHIAQHGFSPMDDLRLDEPVPGADELAAAYRQAVRRIAGRED